MSDPIRSISQNNYLLATQQEVSHDNTLTGNGTPESPLGVANSSDETVLWENSSGSTSATPSESLFNFEYVDFYVNSVASNNTQTMPAIYRVKIISGMSAVGFCASYWDGSKVRAAPFGITIGSTLSFISSGVTGYSNKIYKVVGIKRISNS